MLKKMMMKIALQKATMKEQRQPAEEKDKLEELRREADYHRHQHRARMPEGAQGRDKKTVIKAFKNNEGASETGSVTSEPTRSVHNSKRHDIPPIGMPPGLQTPPDQPTENRREETTDYAAMDVTPPGGRAKYFRMDIDERSAMPPSRENSIDRESSIAKEQSAIILELRAEMQNMKNNMQNVEATQVNAQVQALLLQCQQQEAIVKQQLESTNVLEIEESRLKLQESDFADRLSRSSEELATLSSEGQAYTIRMSEDLNNARSETTAERTMMLDQKAAHEKMMQKMNGEHQQQEVGLTTWKQEAKIENDKNRIAEVTIERMNENAIKIEADHGKVLEEMAKQSEERLNASITKAKEDAKIVADDVREEKMTRKQLQETKLEAERKKTADAVQAVTKAEDNLKDEIKMKTMKGDELQKWSRDEIHSLKLEATKKLSEYEAAEIKHTIMMTEAREKIATAEVEMNRNASKLQSVKTTGVASTNTLQ